MKKSPQEIIDEVTTVLESGLPITTAMAMALQARREQATKELEQTGGDTTDD